MWGVRNFFALHHSISICALKDRQVGRDTLPGNNTNYEGIVDEEITSRACS
jgi:hypothetical protein